jgi:hypothetical protein
MFGLIEDLAKAAVGVVKLPLDVAADALTLGGALTDKPKPYTAEGISDVMQNLKNAAAPKDGRQ